MWPVTLSGRLCIIALVSRYLTNQLMHRRLIRMRGLGPFSIPKMPSGCSSCISCRFQPLSTTYGQIAHVLLTRSPLGLRKQASFRLVRLACIRHAASVHPEPGSNSPFAHSFTLSRFVSFLRFLYSVFIGIDVSCSVFKDRPPRGLPAQRSFILPSSPFYVKRFFHFFVAVKRFCHLSLRENVTILFLNKLTSCIVIYRRCF